MHRKHICWGYHVIDTYLAYWLIGCSLAIENISPIVVCVCLRHGLALGTPLLLRVGMCLQSCCLAMWMILTVLLTHVYCESLNLISFDKEP